MWIKKNNIMINLDKYDAIRLDMDQHDLIILVSSDKKSGVGYYERASKIIDEIAEAMKNNESVYVMPCEKE